MQIIQEEENIIEITEVARRLNANLNLDVKIHKVTLRGWLIAYEQQNGIRLDNRRIRIDYTPEEKEEITQRAVQIFKEEENISTAEVARRLNVHEDPLREWLDEYEEQNGPIPGRKKQRHTRYTPEQKEEITRRAVQIFKEEENMTIIEVARRLNDIVQPRTLNNWLNRYEQQNGPIPGRQRR